METIRFLFVYSRYFLLNKNEDSKIKLERDEDKEKR